MPLNFRLTKKRQYNIASKSVNIICVELLDNTVLECTLSADHTGKEFLDNVCQRLEIVQSEFFGLKYVCKRGELKIKWIDLEKPLKKQLDKYSRDRNLYMGVMFYIHDIQAIQDENARYHYFLQLKSDILEGRLQCNYEQAVMLTAYSLQAEFGDHDPQKHTRDYLKNHLVIPKATDTRKLELLMSSAIQKHASLKRMVPSLAELYYMMEVSQMENYGIEYFPAKDETGIDVLIGTSVYGVLVHYLNASAVRHYRWGDIINLVNHKRAFVIECQVADESVQFMLDVAELSKHLWHMCVLQHTFYKQYRVSLGLTEVDGDCLPAPDIQCIASIQPQAVDVLEGSNLPSATAIGNNLFLQPQPSLQSGGINFANHNIVTSTAVDPEPQRSVLPAYRPAPDYQVAVQQKYGLPSTINLSSLFARTQEYNNEQLLQVLHLYRQSSNYPGNRHASSSTPDLANFTMQAVPISRSDPDLLCGSHNRISTTQYTPYPEVHKTYENLAVMTQNMPTTQYIDRGKIYCLQEPLYQNISSLNHLSSLKLTSEEPRTVIHKSSTGYSELEDEYKWSSNRQESSQWPSEKNEMSKDEDQPLIDKPAFRRSKVVHGKGHNAVIALKKAGLSSVIGSQAQKNTNHVAFVDSRIAALESHLNNGEILHEFEQIPRKRANADFTTATLPENTDKNRFKDVLPYEENRVRLIPSKTNRTGYINASHITASVGDNVRFYIASQAPMPHTIPQFWQMIWEQDVRLIVMLTDRNQKVIYWPTKDKDILRLDEFIIIRHCSNLSPNYVTCQLQLQHVTSRRQRTIWHLQYTDWADHGCPEDCNGFIGFLQEMDALRRLTQADITPGNSSNRPVLIHCNAGVGRTGVTILCDILCCYLDNNLVCLTPLLTVVLTII